MSINLENPGSVLGKVDAALNFIGQIRLAMMVGDRQHQEKAINEAERHLNNAMEQLEEDETPKTNQEQIE